VRRDREEPQGGNSDSMARLVLFDIDGTLVLTGGAGIRAMTRAGQDLLGVTALLDGVEVAGRTDWIILRDALRNLGRDIEPALFTRLRDAYLAYLREEILAPGEGTKAVMPGVRELLAALQPIDGVWIGLLTGNFAEGARIKLEHFDLWRYFRGGAFGDDAADRNALVPYAVGRACASGFAAVPYNDVLVIGDTPHDVACAHAVGATPIGVATGSYTASQLVAAGAEIVFDDLGDTNALVRLIGVGRRAG